jgi:serine/threonine-protein kinase
MGTIFEARHPVLGHSVAIKLMTATAPGVFARFEREARAAAQLKSPHIAVVIDLDALPNGQPYMVMELLAGNDLGVEIEQLGRLPVDCAADYVSQALEGIAEAHAIGIVHRDLKPSNLFLCKSMQTAARPVVKLLDFGIVKLADDDGKRLTGKFDAFGTLEYMSPEQMRASRDVDPRADLWSLGIVLYESVVGQTPFEGSPAQIVAAVGAKDILPPSKRCAGIPPWFDAIIAKALKRNPDERFQTAAEFIDALAPFRPEALSAAKREVPVAVTTELVPLFGMLLVQFGRITAKQLRRAMAVQASEPTRRLGDILVAMGACTEADVAKALAKQQDSKLSRPSRTGSADTLASGAAQGVRAPPRPGPPRPASRTTSEMAPQTSAARPPPPMAPPTKAAAIHPETLAVDEGWSAPPPAPIPIRAQPPPTPDEPPTFASHVQTLPPAVAVPPPPASDPRPIAPPPVPATSASPEVSLFASSLPAPPARPHPAPDEDAAISRRQPTLASIRVQATMQATRRRAAIIVTSVLCLAGAALVVWGFETRGTAERRSTVTQASPINPAPPSAGTTPTIVASTGIAMGDVPPALPAALDTGIPTPTSTEVAPPTEPQPARKPRPAQPAVTTTPPNASTPRRPPPSASAAASALPAPAQKPPPTKSDYAFDPTKI